MPETIDEPLTPNPELPTAGPTPAVQKKRPLKIWLRICIWLFIGLATAILTFAIPLHQKILGDYCAERTYGFPFNVSVIGYQYNNTPMGVDKVPVGKRIGNTNMFFEDVGSILAECAWGTSTMPNFLLLGLNALIFSGVFFAVDTLARRTRRIAHLLSPLFVFICWLFA